MSGSRNFLCCGPCSVDRYVESFAACKERADDPWPRPYGGAKKTDVAAFPNKESDHVGLLVNEPPRWGLLSN